MRGPRHSKFFWEMYPIRCVTSFSGLFLGFLFVILQVRVGVRIICTREVMTQKVKPKKFLVMDFNFILTTFTTVLMIFGYCPPTFFAKRQISLKFSKIYKKINFELVFMHISLYGGNRTNRENLVSDLKNNSKLIFL